MSQHNLSINGKRANITREDLLAVAKQNSIRRPEQVIEEVGSTVSNWLQYAGNYKVDEQLAAAINATLIKNL